MISVTKRYSFEASHHLPYYEGACHNVHGHSYKVEVTVSGIPVNDIKSEKCGMIIDFKDLKSIIKTCIGMYDHQNLNKFFHNPTAEVMVERMFEDVNREINKYHKNCCLECIKLWETEDSYAMCVKE